MFMEQHTARDTETIHELVGIVSGVMPMLDSIKQMIEDSSGHIPKASQQLHDVTRATEVATMEILNVLDALTQKVTQAEGGLASLRQHLRTRRELEDSLGAGLQALAQSSPGSGEVARLSSLWAKYQQTSDVQSALSGIERSLEETKSDSINIAMALQVQDITSQQIAGVVAMIETVRDRLRGIVQSVNGSTSAASVLVARGDSSQTPSYFDTDAQFTRSTGRQDAADAIVKEWKKSE
jgi:chemotaxis regulatin CheY-phosphate phosphatase CheZ